MGRRISMEDRANAFDKLLSRAKSSNLTISYHGQTVQGLSLWQIVDSKGQMFALQGTEEQVIASILDR